MRKKSLEYVWKIERIIGQNVISHLSFQKKKKTIQQSN